MPLSLLPPILTIVLLPVIVNVQENKALVVFSVTKTIGFGDIHMPSLIPRIFLHQGIH